MFVIPIDKKYIFCEFRDLLQTVRGFRLLVSSYIDTCMQNVFRLAPRTWVSYNFVVSASRCVKNAGDPWIHRDSKVDTLGSIQGWISLFFVNLGTLLGVVFNRLRDFFVRGA